MGQALYRKYRSKSLDEVVGQSHITDTLKKAIASGKISHAYLFTGPKGVGKTSVARILAHELNKFAYDDSQSYLDIIEIDAASNRRIDEIRDLRDKVHTAPTSGKYKIYIIDEVHMLTKEAFNALLKTLEEPPAHAIFILATTEAHKLPDTIISRTQRFTFRPINKADAIKHLQSLAKAEKISIDNGALELIIDHADGSFRDSISLLDQARNVADKISQADVERMLGIAPLTSIRKLVAALNAHDQVQTVEQLDELLLTGATPQQIAKQLVHELRSEYLTSKSTNQENTGKLMRELIEVPASQDPEVALQLVLVEFALQNPSQSATHTEKVIPTPPPVEHPTLSPPAEKPKTPPNESNDASPSLPDELPVEDVHAEAMWADVVSEIKKHHNTLYSIARMAQCTVDGDTITLVFGFPFHQKRLDEPKNKQIIQDIVKKVTGKNFSIRCNLQAKSKRAAQPSKETPDTINTISNIFGSAEVLES